MLHQVKSRPIQVFFAILTVLTLCAIIVVDLAFEASAFAEDLPETALMEYTISAGDDGRVFKAGTINQPGSSSPSAGEVFVGKRIVHQQYYFEGSEETTNPPMPAQEAGYRYNGQINVAIDVTGENFTNEKGESVNPLVRLNIASGQESQSAIYLEVRDSLHDFILVDESVLGNFSELGYNLRKELDSCTKCPIPHEISVVVLEITDPKIITAEGGFKVDYVLKLDTSPSAPALIPGIWYTAGQCQAKFRPNPENPMYGYFKPVVELKSALFCPSWNDGSWGLNALKFNDPDIGLFFTFPANRGVMGEKAYLADGVTRNPKANWNTLPNSSDPMKGQNPAGGQVAVYLPNPDETPVPGTLRHLDWHLEWNKGILNERGEKVYVITIDNAYEMPDGSFAPLRYTLYVGGYGGSTVERSTREILSGQEWVSLDMKGDNIYNWAGDVLISDLEDPIVGRIKLDLETEYKDIFNMDVQKSFGSDEMNHHKRWGMNDSTWQYVRIKVLNYDDSGIDLYLDFDAEVNSSGQHVYTQTGYSRTGTLIKFSVNKPAIVRDVRCMNLGGDILDFQAIEVLPWNLSEPRAPDIAISYQFDHQDENDTGFFIADFGDEGAQDASLIITNEFHSPSFGEMQIIKTLEGHFVDWGLNMSSQFFVKVWDSGGWNGAGERAGNYLLFRPSPETGDPADWPYAYVAGTLYCTGNTGLDDDGDLAAYLSAYEAYMETDGASQNAWLGIDDFNLRTADPISPWQWSDFVWARKVLDGEETVLTKLTISPRSTGSVALSNLWPGEYEVHEFDRHDSPVPYIDPDNIDAELVDWSTYNQWNDGINEPNYGKGGIVSPADLTVVNVANRFLKGEEEEEIPDPPPPPKPPEPKPPEPKPAPKPEPKPAPKPLPPAPEPKPPEPKLPVVKHDPKPPSSSKLRKSAPPAEPKQPARNMPKTGDAISVGLLVALLAGAGTTAALAVKKGKKGKSKDDQLDDL